MTKLSIQAALLIVATLVMGVGAAAAQAPDTTLLVLEKGSRLWLEGTSNLHDWSCQAGAVSAAIHVAGRPAGTSIPGPVYAVQVEVPVKELDCGNSKMEANLRKALDAKSNPVIAFHMRTSREIADSVPGRVRLAVAGDLTLAGVTRPIAFEVVGQPLGGDAIQVTGRVPVLMTDFGVKPPTAMLGLLKTGDQVVVRFDLATRYSGLAVWLEGLTGRVGLAVVPTTTP